MKLVSRLIVFAIPTLVTACAAGYLLWTNFNPPPSGRFPPLTPREPGDLSVGDETTLRGIVAKHEMATQYWTHRDGDIRDAAKRWRVLCLSRTIRDFYHSNPVGTLRALKRIVVSGHADDAHTAIAYAHAAVGYENDDSYQLISAEAYTHYPTPNVFDDQYPGRQQTFRLFAVEEIDGLIADAAKRKPPSK